MALSLELHPEQVSQRSWKEKKSFLQTLASTGGAIASAGKIQTSPASPQVHMYV